MQTITVDEVSDEIMNDLKEIKNIAFKTTSHGPFYSQADNKYYNLDTVAITTEHYIINLEGKCYEDKGGDDDQN